MYRHKYVYVYIILETTRSLSRALRFPRILRISPRDPGVIHGFGTKNDVSESKM